MESIKRNVRRFVCFVAVGLVVTPLAISAEDRNSDGRIDGALTLSGTPLEAPKSANIAPNGTFYALEWSTGGFYTIDVNSGPSVVTNTIPTSMQALALHPDGRLFGGRGAGGDLYIIDKTTGVHTIFAAAVVNDIRGMAFRPDGALFIADFLGGNGSLVRIDDVDSSTATTNLGTTTGPGMFGSTMQGLEFQGSNLFGVTPDFGIQSGLYSISTTDGSATFIGDPGIDVYQSIAFSQDGRLFAIGNGAGSFFCEISPTTGSTIGTPIDVSLYEFRGLEFEPSTSMPLSTTATLALLVALFTAISLTWLLRGFRVASTVTSGQKKLES